MRWRLPLICPAGSSKSVLTCQNVLRGTARATLQVHRNLMLGAIKTQRLIIVAHLDRAFRDVVEDERAAEAVGAGIWR